jgi:hypothetical protein
MDEPDIEIGAVVRAKRLRFHKRPETDVQVEGDGGSGSERHNLPETVEPGVTYRDVTVRWLAAARLDPTDERLRERDNDGKK